MKRKKFRLSDSDKESLKAAVSRAEGKTSGEIVPFIVSSSGDYLWVHLFWALGGGLAAWPILWKVASSGHFAMGMAELVLGQWAGVIIGAMIPLIPWVKRMSVPAGVLNRNVHRAVMASFVGAGLTETKDRTGVLLYLSVFERRIQILAEKGINEKMPKGYWQSHVDKIVKGIHSGRPAQVLCEVIDQIGDQLASTFPRAADDVNELSDEVHLEPAD